MTHQPNRTLFNEPFKRQTVFEVWNKAVAVPGYNKRQLRKDRCGAWIMFAHYGDINSEFGWEVDHEKPVAKGGTDDIDNLQPLHWRNNRGKGDDWPDWTCVHWSIP